MIRGTEVRGPLYNGRHVAGRMGGTHNRRLIGGFHGFRECRETRTTGRNQGHKPGANAPQGPKIH